MPIEDFGVKLPSTLITKPTVQQPIVQAPSLAMGEGEKEIENEYYAGFESELKGYGNQSVKAQRNVNTAGAALEKARQIRRGRQSTKYGTPAGGAQGFGIKSKEEIKQEALYAQAVDAMSVLTWKQYIMVSLPRLIQSSDVTSIEEAVKLTNPKVYGDAEREWLTNTWNKLKYLTTTQITITASTTNEEARTELLDALLAEQKLPIQSINSLTLDELMKSFHPLASDLPPGMTTDEARDLLSQVEMSPEEQAEIENFRNITQELLNNWKTTSSYFDLLKAGAVESATLPPLTAAEFAKLAWTQPWNATMELLEKFNNMVSRPWAAWFITSTPHWDQDSDAAALDRLFQEYREQGESVWDAYSLAFQNWGTNVWLKMFYETIFDPTNYIGLGIATKITKPIKYLGPLVGAIETGWNELWDVPFRGMRTLWNAIPKTPLQHSIAVGKQILMDGRAVLQRIYPNKPSLVRITAPEVISEFEKCIQEAIANPQELGNLRVRLGRQLLDHDFIDAEQMTEILSKAKIGNIDDLITPQALLDLNKDFDLFQVGSVYKSSKELAEQTLARRGSRTVDEIAGLAKQLDNLKAKIVSEAMDLKGGTAKEILDGILRSAEDLDLRKTSSTIYRFANQAGKATSWAGRTIDSITRNNAVSWVERNVASSLANQYLLFTNYGPFNVLENTWRSMLGEGTMLYPLHASPVDELLQKGKGLSNLPYEFVTYQKGLGRMEMAVIDPKTNKTLVFNQGKIPGITKKLPFGFNIHIGNSDYVMNSWQHWNDMFGDIGAQQRAWYLSKQFDKQLWKANSTEMQSIADVFTETRGLLDDVKGITKKEKDELERVLFSDAVGSPANILAHDVPLPELERRRALKQINETLNKMNDVYSIHKNTIRNEILDGTIWKDVDGRIEAIKQSIREFNILGLQAESKVLSNMVKDVAEFVPETADDLMRTLGFVSDLTDAIGERISEVRSTIRNRARVLTEAEASNFNEASSKMLGDFLGQADTDMTAMIEAVKANVAKSKVKMTKTQKQRLETLTDALKMRSQNILATRDADRKLLNSYFDKKSPTFVPKNKRSNSFWEKLESERNEKIWAVYRARENELFGQVEEMKLSLMDAMKVKIDLPTAIPPVVGKLTPAHLAYLMGCTGTDLYKGLTRAGAMATIRPKDKFITWAYTKANRYASHLGKTAEEIGFSKDAISDVWEQMFKNIGIDPKMANAEPLAPAMLQMEQVRQDLQRIRGTKGLPEDDYLKFKNYLNETARKVGDLDIYNKTVKQVEIPKPSEGIRVSENIPNWGDTEFHKSISPTMRAKIDNAVYNLPSDISLSRVKRIMISTPKLLNYRSAKWIDSEGILQLSSSFTKEDVIHELIHANKPGMIEKDVEKLTQELSKVSHISLSAMSDIDISFEFSNLQRRSTDLTPSEALRKNELQNEIMSRQSGAKTFEEALAGISKNTQNTVRLYRAEGIGDARPSWIPDNEAWGRWWTNNLDEAKAYLRDFVGEQGRIIYKDIPISEAEKFRISNLPKDSSAVKYSRNPDIEFFVPKELVSDAIQLDVKGINIPTTGGPIGGTSGADNWLNAKEEAMKRSRQQYELDFPDYENHNMVDAAMRIAFPFWTYESQRYPWLLRTFLRRPGTLTGIGRYTEYTDNGYITIPGTDIQFNPLRGTVFMGGFRRLAMRDYPEYYDAMPGMQIIDFVSRIGFYPGAHVMLPIVAIGTAASRKPEWGEVLPAWAKSTLDLARAVAPEQAGAVIDTIFPDRFRDYLTMLTLGEMGYDADAIWNKKTTGAKLTPDETALWLKAESKATGLKGILFEQSGIFRLRPEEYTKVLKDYKLLIEAMTGVSVEIQEQIESRYPVTGKRFADYFPLDILQQKILNEYEGYKRWQGVTTPLYPSGWQIQDIKIRQYYEAVDQLYVEARTIGKFDALGNQTEYSINDLTQQMIDGKINPAQWNSRRGDLLTKAAAASTEMGRLAYPDVPKTLAEREAHWKERGVPVPTYSPDEELLYLYYDIQPEMSYNWETDTMEYNFNLYFAKINAMIDTLTGEYKQKFLDRIQYEWNGMERLYWDVNKEYLRPYNQAKELVLESYSAEQQALIRRYEVARGDERENIKSLPGPDGNLLISGFTSKLSKVRKALRNIDMEMDAWLYFFGITDTFVNSGSETYYKNLTQQYMVDAMAK